MRENKQKSVVWYQDCMGLTLVLSGCLGPGDLARRGRKAGLWPDGAPSDPARLVRDVREACGVDPGLRKNIAKRISRKEPDLLALVRASHAEDIGHLEYEVQRPQYLLWACLTDPREEVRECGRVLAHNLIRTALAEPSENRDEPPLPRELDELSKRHRELARENSALKTKLDRVRDKLKSQREFHAEAQDRLLSSVGNLGQQREIKKLRHELARLQEELAQYADPGEVKPCLCREARLITPEDLYREGPDCPHCNKDISCRDCPLQGRRVAVIGGLDRMESIYRQVVEKLGGEFEFHCGRVKDGCQSVQGLISRSDYVIYITTINSHASMRATKTICKKSCKRFIALKERGAGSLERRLREVSQG